MLLLGMSILVKASVEATPDISGKKDIKTGREMLFYQNQSEIAI